MYVMICTKQYLAHTISVVSKFLLNPRRQHWDVLKWIFKYLKGNTNYDILFSKQYGNPLIMGYVDGDNVEDLDDRRSTMYDVFTLVGGRFVGSLWFSL